MLDRRSKSMCFGLAILVPMIAAADEPPTKPVAPPKYTSPDDCYQAMRAALKRADAVAELACCSDAAQNQYVGDLAHQLQKIALGHSEFKEDVVALFTKHEIDDLDILALVKLDKVRGYHVVGTYVDAKAEFI